MKMDGNGASDTAGAGENKSTLYLNPSKFFISFTFSMVHGKVTHFIHLLYKFYGTINLLTL